MSGRCGVGHAYRLADLALRYELPEHLGLVLPIMLGARQMARAAAVAVSGQP